MADTSQTSRAPRRSRTQLLRRLTQTGFGLFIIVSSIRHFLVTSEHVASIDGYCPFGGMVTAWRWLSTGGLHVQKTHQSNLVLLLGLIAGVIVAGGAFCGWIYPFGALQDLVDWIARRRGCRRWECRGDRGTARADADIPA